MQHTEYSVIYEKADEGGYYAHIPALDITTEGETLEEAQEMARDAIENTLACLRELNLPFPNEIKPKTLRSIIRQTGWTVDEFLQRM